MVNDTMMTRGMRGRSCALRSARAPLPPRTTRHRRSDRSRPRGWEACRAKGSQGGSGPLDVAADIVESPLYNTYLQGAVAVGLLAAIDAGWSGDWSRIDAITTEQEAQVRTLVTYVGCFHLACAPVSFFAVQRKSGTAQAAKATAKTLLIGGLACGEAIFNRPKQ